MRKINRQKGFTLVELIVAISIVIIFTGITLINYRGSGKQLALQRSANKLAQDVRKAQAMAMSAKELTAGVVPPGYGAFFKEADNKQYILYADTAPPPDGNNFYSGGDSEIEVVKLEQGVVIQDINTAPDKVSINFEPPDPIVAIKPEETDDPLGAVEIILALEDDLAKTKTIRINKAGLIEVAP